MTSIRKAKKAWKSQYPFDTTGMWQRLQRIHVKRIDWRKPPEEHQSEQPNQ